MTDVPKCSFCKKKYSVVSSAVTNHSPVLLRCGHTFCKHCVSKWAYGKQEIECYRCKVKTRCRDGKEGVQHLWPNLYLAGVMSCIQEFPSFCYQFLNFDGITANQKPANKKKLGQLCSECINAQATCRCVHCQVNMCKKCFGVVHSHSRFLRQHHSIPLRPSLITTECQLHCRLLEFFCEEDEMPICPECMINVDHKGHTVVRMVDKYKSSEEALITAQAQTSSALSHTDEVKSVLKLELENIQYDAYQQADYIHRCFQDCVGSLQARFLGLLRELQTCAEMSCHEVLKLLEGIETKEFLIREAFHDAELVLSNETRRQVVANPDKILAVLKTSEYLPFAIDTMHINADGNEENLTSNENCQRFCFSLNPEIALNIQNLGEIRINTNIKYRLQTLQECPGLLDIPVQEYSKEDVAENDNKPNAQLLRQLQEPHAKSQELVHVTFMESPSNFRVQRWTDKSHLNAIERCLKVYKTRKPMVDEILTRVSVGDSCVAFYEPVRSWYRGRIMRIVRKNDIDPDEQTNLLGMAEEIVDDFLSDDIAGPQDVVDVLFIDFGNTARTKVSCLRRLPDKLKTIPDLAILCSLNNVSPVNDGDCWSQDVINYFSKIVGDRPLLMTTIKREKGCRMVDLHKPAADEIDADVPTSVRDAFVFLGLARLTATPLLSHVPDNVIARKYLTPSLLSVSTFVSVVVSDFQSLNRFSVQQTDSNMTYLTQLMTKIQSWVRKKLSAEKQASKFAESLHHLQILCPIESMVCLAQYSSDSKWYRAQISKVNDNQTVEVVYVDFGDIATIHFSKLLKIPEFFTRLPVQALPCQLCDVSPLTNEEEFSETSCRRFAELCSQFQMLMEIRAVKDGVYYVDLYDYTDQDPSVLSISDRLYREGLIVRINKSDDDKVLTAEQQGCCASPAPEKTKLNMFGIDCGVTELLESIKMPVIEDGQNMRCRARVTNAITPDLFYIQTENQKIELNKIMLLLQKDMKLDDEEAVGLTADDAKLMNVDGTLNVGDLCAVKSIIEKRWCRGRVQSYDISQIEPTCEVVLLDYGWVETMKIQELRTLPDEYNIDVKYITKCSLGSIQPAGGSAKWTSTAISLFQELITGEECLMDVMKNIEVEDAEGTEILPVEVWISKKHQLDSGKDDYVKVSRLLELEGLALPVKNRSKQGDTGYEAILDSVSSISHHCFKPLKVRQNGEKIANPTMSPAPDQDELECMQTNQNPSNLASVQNDDASTSEDDITITLDIVEKEDNDKEYVHKRRESQSENGNPFENANEDKTESLFQLFTADKAVMSSREYSNVKILSSCEYIPCFVSHIESPSVFYVRLRAVEGESDAEEILDEILEWQKIMTQVQDVAKNILTPLAEYDLRSGEPCLCRYIGDEKWHRAIILMTPSSQQSIAVQYVDFGTIENVPHGRLRRIPDCLLTMPIQAFMCRIINNPTTTGAVSSIDLVEEFSHRVEGRELLAENCGTSKIHDEFKHFQNMYTVSLFSLDAEGLLYNISGNGSLSGESDF